MQTHGSVEVVQLSGKLDARVASHLRDRLCSLPAAGQARLVVDLSDVSFVDSSGLSALVAGFKAARNAGGDMALCSLQASVRSIVELTRLQHVFNVFAGAKEAVASFAD